MFHFKNISRDKTLLFMFFLTCIFLFFSPEVLANNFDTTMFDISEADISKTKFLDIYFPEDDMSKSPLSAALLAFNSVVLMVGGIIVSYTLMAGTMSTAHDGEILGKKWSSMWLPIRMATSTAFLVPVSGGFCAIQMFMLWVIQMSIGAASHVWQEYVANMGVANGVLIPNMSNEKLGKVAKSAFLSNLCVLKTNALHAQVKDGVVLKAEMGSGEGGGNVYIPPKASDFFFVTMFTGDNNTLKNLIRDTKTYSYKSFNYGSNHLPGITGSGTKFDNSVYIDDKYYALGRDMRACGAFLMPDTLPDVDDKLANFKELTGLFKTIVSGQPEYFMALQNEMKQLAQQYMEADGSINLAQAFDNSIVKYKTVVSQKVAQTFARDKGWDAYIEAVKKDGWALAGSWSIRLIQIQELLGQLTNIYPTVISPSLTYEQLSPNGNELEAFMNKAGKDIMASEANSKYMTGLATIGAKKDSDATENDKQIDPEEKSKALDGLFDGINKKSQELFSLSGGISVGSFVESGESSAGITNPLTIAKYYGDTAISLGWILLGVAAGTGAVMGAMPFSGGWFLTITGAASLVMPISITLWIVGNSLSVLLPLTPYMLWIGMLGGWMILVLEAMVSAPLWVVTQLQPDADGFTGKGSTGYGLVLSLALRPTLMIIGLICSIELLNILGSIVSITFVSMISTSGLAGGSIIKQIGLLFVYFGLLYTIINRSFSLIHIIPDETMKWLNINGGQNLASYAKDSQNTMMAKAALTKGALDQAGGALSKGATGMSRGLDKGIGALKNKIDKNKLDNKILTSGAGAGDFSQNSEGLARQANDKFDISKRMAKLGDNQNAQTYMRQAQDLASHIPAEQAKSSGLIPTLHAFAGTAQGNGISGGTAHQGGTENASQANNPNTGTDATTNNGNSGNSRNSMPNQNGAGTGSSSPLVDKGDGQNKSSPLVDKGTKPNTSNEPET